MLDGFLFAIGGWEGHWRLDSMECYNPQNNTWQVMESVKLAVTSPAVVALNGFLYVTGMTGLVHTFVDICGEHDLVSMQCTGSCSGSCTVVIMSHNASVLVPNPVRDKLNWDFKMNLE